MFESFFTHFSAFQFLNYLVTDSGTNNLVFFNGGILLSKSCTQGKKEKLKKKFSQVIGKKVEFSARIHVLALVKLLFRE